jgi:hypothetical protein
MRSYTCKFSFVNRTGQEVVIEFASVRSAVNVTLSPYDSQSYIVCFEATHFANILTALALGNSSGHVPNLPEYCPCEACSESRADLLGKKIAEHRDRIQKEKI